MAANRQAEIIAEMKKLKLVIAEAEATKAYARSLYGNGPTPPQELYFIACGDLVKIGRSVDPASRLTALATGAPGELRLLATFPNLGARESECHRRLQHLKVHGEWFLRTGEVDSLIREFRGAIHDS